jgi:hypothetical protein
MMSGLDCETTLDDTVRWRRRRIVVPSVDDAENSYFLIRSLNSISLLPLVVLVFDFLPVPCFSWSFDVVAFAVFCDDAFESESERVNIWSPAVG